MSASDKLLHLLIQRGTRFKRQATKRTLYPSSRFPPYSGALLRFSTLVHVSREANKNISRLITFSLYKCRLGESKKQPVIGIPLSSNDEKYNIQMASKSVSCKTRF